MDAQWFETNAKGEKKKRRKRGFETKRESLEYERQKKLNNSRNRIDDFIKMCMMRGWVVSRLDVHTQVDVYVKAEEEITFE